MHTWQKSWRGGIAPNLSAASLMALKQALERDDPALLQGATLSPPPLERLLDWPVEAACAVAYAGWKGDGRTSVRQVAEFFGKICYLAHQGLGEQGTVGDFLNWFDDTPREEMRRELLAEVVLSLAQSRFDPLSPFSSDPVDSAASTVAGEAKGFRPKQKKGASDDCH
jgi:hypothetical protein